MYKQTGEEMYDEREALEGVTRQAHSVNTEGHAEAHHEKSEQRHSYHRAPQPCQFKFF